MPSVGRQGNVVGEEPTESPTGADAVLLRRGLRFIQLLVAFSFTVAAACWIGLGDAGLPTNSLVRPALIYPGADIKTWLIMLVVVAAGLGLWFTPTSLLMNHRTDFVQLVGAVISALLVLSFLPFVSGFEFSDPANSCVYETCWPQPYQEILMSAPVFLTSLVMAICGVIGSRLQLLVRVALPISVYVLLAILQYAVWQPLILPFLSGSSPGSH